VGADRGRGGGATRGLDLRAVVNAGARVGARLAADGVD
jgi:hypothetical protein